MSLGLVLGGGGARGSYQIGAYKAMLEMSKQPNIICGTSIGAINGAVIAQGDFESLEHIWESIEIEDILKISKSEKKIKNLFAVNSFPRVFKEICEKKGMDSAPLKKLITKYIDEDKLKQSPVDFALVTYSLTDKKTVIKHKHQIPNGELVDYLMASSAFPGFSTVTIGKKKFADGGFADNIPLSVITKHDVEDIFVIDVGGVGIVKDADTSGKNIITIRSQKPAVGIMEFDNKQIQKNIQYGYYDTKKALGKYVGEIYYINTESYYRAREYYGKELIVGIEKAASVFEVDILREYTIEELIYALKNKIKGITGEDRRASTIKNLSEKEIVCTLANAMMKKNFDFFSNKVAREMLGRWHDAANAIVYFSK